MVGVSQALFTSRIELIWTLGEFATLAMIKIYRREVDAMAGGWGGAAGEH